jgi:MinD-like ATPase involved in chromosome partitioning or flagellar assembly
MKNLIAALGVVDWETQFVSGLGHPMFGLQVQRRCVDGIDVRAAIQVLDCQGVLVSDATPRISQDLVTELSEKNIMLIAVTSDVEHWQNLGANHCIELDPKNPLSGLKQVSEFMRGDVQVIEPASEPKGTLIAIAGFGGSCGRTTAVKETGWQLAKLGAKTCMIDADTYGPSLDQELGYEPSQNGLLDLCRSIEKKNSMVQTHFDLLPTPAENLSLVAGLPRISRWTDLRVSTLREFWRESKDAFDVVLTDVGGVLEVDNSLLHETSLPRRHAAALTALESAAVTLICARADSVGIARLVRGYLEFHELFAHTQVHVLLWGITSEAQIKDVRMAVSRHTGIASIFETSHVFEITSKALKLNTFISKLDSRNEIAKEFEKISHLLYQDLNIQSRTQTSSRKPIRNMLKRAS